MYFITKAILDKKYVIKHFIILEYLDYYVLLVNNLQVWKMARNKLGYTLKSKCITV